MHLRLHLHRHSAERGQPQGYQQELATWSANASREERSTRQEAIRRIETCIKELTKTSLNERMFLSLNLKGLPLSDINWGKETYKQLQELPNLFLNDTRLTHLPSEIGKLRELALLNCSNARLQELPKELVYCKNLQTLSIQYNQLTSLSGDIFGLPKLHTLNASNNNITSIGSSYHIGDLLEDVNLENNQLSELPEFMKTSNNVTILLKNNPVFTM